ncbi:S8 family serine peptidase [Actinokineospora xionganensis]|uniref:S8 family serine peptidase n=1 Tax=Actinokineospora xionganensis TaxID=2684470 RepID=A0ABR7L5R9_9PSEU|nr:S8 family serine peptidase [Actinokineospora xionganensis]MBC6448036.1 S8 family serine peptidase [Actinokineospora xionganensis]
MSGVDTGTRALVLTGLDRLMARSVGDPAIGIGVLDGPAVLDHPDLAAPITEIRPGACAVATSAACGHGTLVAGVLGARRGTEAPGLAPRCPLLLRPIFTEDGAPTVPAVLADGIVECVAAGARIINVSAAFTGAAPTGAHLLTEALDHAARNGVLVVAATGNEARLGGSPLTTHPWVIPVTACDDSGVPLAASNLGGSIARTGVRAPGARLVSLSSSGGFAAFGGTSAAAPVVTGAIALAWSLAPHVEAATVRAAVRGRAGRGLVPPLLDAVAIHDAVTRS